MAVVDEVSWSKKAAMTDTGGSIDSFYLSMGNINQRPPTDLHRMC